MGYQQSGSGPSPFETRSLLPQSTAPATAPSSASSSGPRTKWWLVAVAVVGVAAFASGTLVARNRIEQNQQGKTITVELEGSKKKKKKKGAKEEEKGPVCDDGNYSKRTLKLAYELPFASLFRDTKGQRKYEASSVAVVDETAYAVCDSSWAISSFDRSLQPFLPTNVQIGDVDREAEDSGYEALFHDDGTFYVVRESIQHGDKSYHAVIEELALGDDDYEIQDQCSCEFEFEGDSKGKVVGVFPVCDHFCSEPAL